VRVRASQGAQWTCPVAAMGRRAPGASLRTTFPLLAYNVLELAYQLLRVQVAVTRWVRDLVHCH